MTKKIIGALAIIVAAILGYAATRPNTFRVERSTMIDASPKKLFPYINDMKALNSWSPWEKKDPAMKRTFSGPAAGVGAAYEWEGNKDVGSGRMEIKESMPYSKVVMALDFKSPMEGHNTVELMLSPQDKATSVTWAIHGPMPYVSKLFTMFCNMDQMIGKEFAAGLAELKTLAEK